jgi:hypothetical protein
VGATITKADVFDYRDGNLLGEVEVDWGDYEARSRQFKGAVLAGMIFDRETIAQLRITGTTAIWLARKPDLAADVVDVESWLEL